MFKSRSFKPVIAVMVILAVLSMSLNAFTFAGELSVSVRIEGISENLFNEMVTVPYEDELTVKDVLIFIDENYDDVTIEGADNNFVTAVNSDVSGTFGGWDGWYYIVDMQSPAVGIGDYVLAGGEEIILYYADGVTQIPVADLSRLDEGIIKFTSDDTTYDEQWNAIVTNNPVVGASVTWSKGSDSVSYTTDENGQIQIAGEYLNPGIYNLQIEKYDVNEVSGRFLPLVLRFASGFTVEITAPDLNETTPGDNTNTIIYIVVIVIALAAVVLVFVRKKKD